MDELTCLLMDTAKLVKSSLTNALKPLNITCRQAVVLRALSDEPLTAKSIGKACSIDKATLSAMLEKLIEHGYVAYDKNDLDRRENIYKLTISGKKILPQISDIEKYSADKLYEMLVKDEVKKLSQYLFRIKESLQ